MHVACEDLAASRAADAPAEAPRVVEAELLPCEGSGLGGDLEDTGVQSHKLTVGSPRMTIFAQLRWAQQPIGVSEHFADSDQQIGRNDGISKTMLGFGEVALAARACAGTAADRN